MKRNNRVFFTDQAEAMASGFRPCGHCMRKDYDVWKAEQPCSNPLPRSSKLV
jgi:methylphosphotriester-DNA--protein-cysteine methyltransferase